jgi:hypothetical protein
MCPVIGKPVSCEIHAVIRFIRAKNIITAKTHRELCTVCGQNVTSGGAVRQRCRMFKDGRTNVHDEERNGGLSVVCAILFKMLTKKFLKDGDSQFQNFRVNFHKFHALFCTRLSQTRLSQVLRKMDSENAHGCAQNAKNSFGFDFLERYNKDGDEFLSHNLRLTGDEIWVSFVNAETKEK